jgi:hypothetical protein
MDKELLKEYHERNIRWTDKSLGQLSFFSSLVLSLGSGFITFGYKNMDLQSLIVTLTMIDWPITLSVLSIISTAISILLGLLIGLNRLWDFRITRQINQIRQRMYEHSEKTLDEDTPQKYKMADRVRLCIRLFREKYPEITIEQCKKFRNYEKAQQEKIEEDFRELRTISHNIGLNTWSKTKYQTVLFGLGILLFVISELIR